MAQDLFGDPFLDDDDMQISFPLEDTDPPTEQGDIPVYGGIGLSSATGTSEPVHSAEENPFVDDEDDEEFEQYSRLLANDHAAVAADPEEALVQAGQLEASWRARPPTWGPGINGEIIPHSLLPLYTNIPTQYQTYEYWRQLVDTVKTNNFLTPRFWVAQMVRTLAKPTTMPEALFGWNDLSFTWRFFFLTDRSLFTANSMTPELWISMVNNLHTSTPDVWRRELPPLAASSQAVERGNPTNYVSQYVPTIPTGATMLTINPEACGPIPKQFDFTKRKFYGGLAINPQYWGDFFDDGPRKEGEDEVKAKLRIRWARANMGIIRRPTEKLPPIHRSPDVSKTQQMRKERDSLRIILNQGNKQRAKAHERKMDVDHAGFDPEYRDSWRKQQKDRRAENNRRRQAAYESAARYYRHMGLPDPPIPEPPEDSDDDYFFDPVDPMVSTLIHVGENRTNEPYRCKPCVDEKGHCNYKSTRFPCRRCVEMGREDECVTSRPDLVQKAKERNQKTQAGENWRENYTFARPKGPFIPSFSIPPEHLDHKGVRARPAKGRRTKPIDETPGALGGSIFQLLEENEPQISFEEAVTGVKRKIIPGLEIVDDEGPKKKKGKAAGKAEEKPKGQKASSKGTTKKTPAPRGRKPRGRKKDDKDEHFEPCDNCEAIGHIDWCDKARPCTNCVLNDRAGTCDASRQDQPYTTNPGGLGDNGDFDILDDPFNNSVYVSQQMSNLPYQSSPLPPLDPNEAAPYSYIQEDIAQLYATRSHLGGLPIRRPDKPEDIMRAFIIQDRSLRRDDPNYRPLTLVQNVEAYAILRLTAMVDDTPRTHLRGSDPTFTGALWQGPHVTMPSAEIPVTEADVLRSQAQQPHSPSQSIENFGVGLVLRQTNRHEQAHSPSQSIQNFGVGLALRQRNTYEHTAEPAEPIEPSFMADDGMDWLMDDVFNPQDESILQPSYNAQSFDATFDNIFRDVEQTIDPALLELEGPAIPPNAEVTTEGIASALQATSNFVYPITWYLENLRSGYNVANELATTDRETTHCTEDLNFWNPAAMRVVPCPSPNGIACDAWTCTNNASCESCWARQKLAAPSVEMRIVANTKAWFCKSCKAALDEERMRPNTVQPMLNRCYCVSQLQETRLCNADRVAVRESIAKKAAEEAANMASLGWTGRCGQCWSRVEDVTTGAWRCICCSQVATVP